MEWVLENKEFIQEQIELNGNKYLLSNGYMGYRGTLEEYTKEQYTASILSGLYDQVQEKWREPVNAPNGLYVRLYCDEQPVNTLEGEIKSHQQLLDIKQAVHKRETVFGVGDNSVMVKAERFLSLDEVHLMCMKYTIKPMEDCKIRIETGIDGDVWDINGPHLKELSLDCKDNYISIRSLTNESEQTITTVEGIDINFGNHEIKKENKAIIRIIEFKAKAGVEYTFKKYVVYFTSADNVEDTLKTGIRILDNCTAEGYKELLARHKKLWQERWEKADVIIEGDEQAQFALRYSLYHLMSAAPVHSDQVSIPARGLSSQVYKGATFWDTELYMLPFFIYTFPQIAKNLVKYRINSLQAARAKAKEYGYRGAFYAWESQDRGREACTHFNVMDVFTGRPIRTYFRDKQIHISADVVYGIWQYFMVTGDESILLEGGAEVILESARFYYSYSYYNKDKNRYEILDVTGPDEYHERVNNNPYTNRMVQYTIELALQTMELLKNKYEDECNDLLTQLDYFEDIEKIKDLKDKIYIPEPIEENGIIQQFDNYLTLEDVSLQELKARIIKPNEYLGGTSGLATTTQIIKQADIVLLLNQFKDEYSHDIKKANWEYYEPRTEHGSSLSSCVYAMLAAHLGKIDWAYKYFMKTATIDLTGEYKQYVGTLFVGGTHLAANGGAWLAALFGFAGLRYHNGTLMVKPKLPKRWKRMKFNIQIKDEMFTIDITKNEIKVKKDQGILIKI